MIRQFRYGKSAILASILALYGMAGPAWAVLTVESSTAPEIAQDAEFQNDQSFDVPEGAEINLFRSDDGTTHTIKGPYRGTLADYIRRQCGLPTVDCRPTDHSGGVRGGPGLTPNPGGVRGIVRPPD